LEQRVTRAAGEPRRDADGKLAGGQRAAGFVMNPTVDWDVPVAADRGAV
jgi:hypothetical protein